MNESVKYWRKTVAANPRQSEIIRQLGEILSLMRNYEEAEGCFRNAIRLSPDNAASYGELARTFLLWKGDIRSSYRVVEDGLRYGREGTGEDDFLKYMKLLIALINEDFDAAIQDVNMMKNGVNNQFVYHPQSLLHAQVEEMRGSRSRARTLYQESLETIQRRLREFPDDERAHSSLGIAYAGLGRFEDAVRKGEYGRDLLPIEKEAWRGSYRLIDLAHIHTMAGNHAKAIDILERLVDLPSDISRHWIKLDPRWKPLRGSGRFQAVLESGL